MSLKGWVVDQLFGSAIKEKVEEQLKSAASAVTSERDKGWRKITDSPERKLTDIDQDRMIEVAFWLWKNNPLANWIIEVMTSFVAGEGFRIEASNEKVKELLVGFWNDPVNNLNIYIEKHTRELGLYGEQCWPKFTSENAGTVRLGYIDPAQIKEVITDPDNVKMVIGIILKGRYGLNGRKLKTVLPPEADEILSPAAELLREKEFTDGECYLFTINNVTNEPRGTSDIWVIADWLDAYEQFLFDYADKWPLLNSFVWDLMVQGAGAAELDEWVKTFTKKSGSVFAHNEKIEINAVTPDLKAVDAEAGARLIRNHILGSKGLPEHWYGGGGDVNRATALEMGAPAFKMLARRQLYVIHMWSYVLTDVLRTADAKGMLNGVPDAERTFKLITPELAAKDITKFSSAIQQLTTSLAQANLNEWIDKDTAIKIFSFALSFIGYELDVEAIKTAIEEEQNKKPYKDYLGNDPKAK